MDKTADIDHREDLLDKFAREIPGVLFCFEQRPTGEMTMLFASEMVRTVWGVSPEELRSDARLIFSRIHPDDLPIVIDGLNRSPSDGVQPALEYRMFLPGRGYRWMETIARPDISPNGALQWYGYSQDISERREADERMRMYATVFQSSHSAAALVDTEYCFIDVNDAFRKMSGYARDELIGKSVARVRSTLFDAADRQTILDSLERGGVWQGMYSSLHKSGAIYHCQATVSQVKDVHDKLKHMVIIQTDMTAVREQQQRLEQLAHFDPLTHLPNRTLLAERIEHQLVAARKSGKQVAVCYLDLDQFKPINDRYGHGAGDELLILAGRRMQAALRKSDTVARLGGDEFALVLADFADLDECELLVQRVLREIKRPFSIGEGEEVSVSASLGLTVFPLDNSDPDTLLRHADHAMYQAKRSGNGHFHFFDSSTERRARLRRDLELEFEIALAKGHLVLHYEPKVDMRRGRVTGVEALIRWQHPERGLQLPSTFLPMVKDTKLILAIGEWVNRQALQQLESWLALGLDIDLSVNIAARHLQQPEFAANLIHMLGQYDGLCAQRLQLEIVENVALKDFDKLAEVMHRCCAAGISFALDDFGTGYSSLSYLRRLPAQTLKIDQSFVSGVLVNEEDRALVSGIIGLARSFKRTVVAEGVESLAHGIALLELGCDLGQGWGIARAMSADRIPAWIATFEAAPLWQSAHPRCLNPA